MGKSFKWVRHTIDADEYAKKMHTSATHDNANVKQKYSFTISSKEDDKKYTVTLDREFIEALTDTSKNSNAYKAAHDVRKFEIDKYWQRTLYFWGFITAIYVAYYNVLKDFYTKDGEASKHGAVPLLILASLGLFFCVSWLLASKGSKHWQENWENHLDMLEDEITGPLYKIYKTNTSNSFSVSNINIALAYVLCTCAYGLFVFELISFVKTVLKLNGTLGFAITVLAVMCTTLSLFMYVTLVHGNTKKNGSIEFDFKEYGGPK
ncbi:MAG: hypothetical protein IJU92_08045 [Spirochaetaceae bacterium]|nr:hypothetical protein [Spirochaetaceae bacterium]